MLKRSAPELPVRQAVRLPLHMTSMERRGTAAGGLVAVEGIASVFGYRYDVYGGPQQGGWTEEVAKGAFDETLATDPDVVMLINHDGMPIARTLSKTLELTSGKTGLEMRAELDPRDPDVSALLVKLERGDVSEMSFGFRVTSQAWATLPDYPDDEMALRTITGVNLNRGDVSAVTYGASDATTIKAVRSEDASDENREEDAGGMPVAEGAGGMPVHLLHLLRIPPNPYLRDFQDAYQGSS